MVKKVKIKWLDAPELQDYPAASWYLELLYDKKLVNWYIRKLKIASISSFKAKDIFRASGLSLLGVSNSHVKKDIKKIHEWVALSPLLLVRDVEHGKLVIADWYHRLCAVYRFDEDAIIPCKIC